MDDEPLEESDSEVELEISAQVESELSAPGQTSTTSSSQALATNTAPQQGATSSSFNPRVDQNAAPVAHDEGPHQEATGLHSPELLTKRYMKLLASGKLASKGKELRSSGVSPFKARPAPEQPARHDPEFGEGDEGSPDISRQRSVHKHHIAKMRHTAEAMEVGPVHDYSSNEGSKPSSPSPSSPSARHRLGSCGNSPRRLSAVSMGSGTRPCSPGNGMGPYQFHKLYTPGPGAYTPSSDRYGGRDSSSFGFGTARQRPAHVCIHDVVVSPGPVYHPQLEHKSTWTAQPQYRFGRQAIGSRSQQDAGKPSNSPHFNPGPGNYEAIALAAGGKTCAGADAPNPTFGHSQKLMSPWVSLSATQYLSEAHAMHENRNIHSPGPARYSPENHLPSSCATRLTAAHFSIGAKAPSYFDLYLDPTRQTSPGPALCVPPADRNGKKSWGTVSATFGKAPKDWSPELNLAAAPFITKAHEQANLGIHSPGPVAYCPRRSQKVATPVLSGGQLDRFYSRFEPSRLS